MVHIENAQRTISMNAHVKGINILTHETTVMSFLYFLYTMFFVRRVMKNIDFISLPTSVSQ
uniref:Uncharacterized protein n=1 Tax=Rhizophora mucronata TaxID=61149 RepID=A0A2P2NUK7_RHIMU